MRIFATTLSLIVVFSLVSGHLLAGDEEGASLREQSSLRNAQRILDSLHEPSGWSVQPRSAREGVDVFKKDIPGFELPAFRGEKVVAVPSDVLFDMLVDFGSHAGMSDRVPLAISEVLKKQGDVVDFFQLVDTPRWTMARDRAWFNRAVISRNYAGVQGQHRQTWQTLSPEHYPERWQKALESYPRVLHLLFSYGSWEVVPLGPSSTRLIYRVLTHPGGRIPNGLQEVVTGKTLPDNLLQFEELALQRADH